MCNGRFRHIIIGIVAWVMLGIVVSPSQAQQPPRPTETAKRVGGEMVVPLNKSQVLHLDHAFQEVSVGNPKVADVRVMSDRTVYVLGKEIGTTNITVYNAAHQPLAVIDVMVSYDVEGLKNRLHELMPAEPLEVRAGQDSLILSGMVSSNQQLSRALAVAERYAPTHVTNLLKVRGAQQVLLAVKVAEVSRTTARALGLKPDIIGGDFVFSTLDPIDTSLFGVAAARLKTRAATFETAIDALEKNGAVKILAEPNLICLSGDTANFLAGGEFPIPVAQNNNGGYNTITIEFKQFGVSLAFTPTVIDGDLINLVVRPEVSKLDTNNSIVLNGLSIPGLDTRRASTTVELRDGQSFAVAGLIQNDFTDQVRQLPGLGELPILGALFRSSNFQNQETELVITVTPHLVHPVAPGSLATPADHFTGPSDADLFLFGKIEGDSARRALGAQSGGGLDGTYGHIIR